MKRFLPITLCCALMAGAARTTTAADRWSALSMLETGNNDRAVGSRGEVSRWQIMPAYWPGGNPQNAHRAKRLAIRIMDGRVTSFEKQWARQPSAFEWALLWHCPARVDHPTDGDRDYATRFVNLAQ